MVIYWDKEKERKKRSRLERDRNPIIITKKWLKWYNYEFEEEENHLSLTDAVFVIFLDIFVLLLWYDILFIIIVVKLNEKCSSVKTKERERARERGN